MAADEIIYLVFRMGGKRWTGDDGVDEYNLTPGELIIMQASNVRLGVGSGSEALDEIVLTNLNLILVATVSEGLFKTRRYLKRCPLDSILCSADVPQAVAARVNSTPVLRVAFSEETVTVSFTEGGKRLADRWAESVRRAAAGNIDAIDTSELPSGTAAEIADFVDGAVGVVGAVGDSIGSALGASLKVQKPHAEKMAAKVTAKCPGCHAPVAGRKGQGVVCSYCDTKFVL